MFIFRFNPSYDFGAGILRISSRPFLLISYKDRYDEFKDSADISCFNIHIIGYELYFMIGSFIFFSLLVIIIELISHRQTNLVKLPK